MKKFLIVILILTFIGSGIYFVKNKFFEDGFFGDETIIKVNYKSEDELIKVVDVKSFDDFELLDPSEKTEKIFIGWFFDEEFEDIATVLKIMEIKEKEVTLYAKWRSVKFLIEFKDLVKKENGGSELEEFEEVLLDSEELEYGDTLSFKTFYQDIEKQVISWTFKDGSEAEFPIIIKDNLELYAVWGEPDRTIGYDLFGGINNDKNPLVFNSKLDTTIELFVPTKQGYKFLGWKSRKDDKYVTEIETLDSENIELYAEWEFKEFIITLNPNGGGILNNKVIIDFDEKDVFKLPEPTRNGYKFAGWSRFIGENIIYEITIDNFSGIKTLIANWEFVDIEITLDLNGGQSDKKSVVINLDKAYEFDLPTPTKERFKFSHWENQKGKVYGKITINNYKEIEYLKAMWTSIPQTYKIYLEEGSNIYDTVTFNLDTDIEKRLLNTQTKDRYKFLGWVDQYGSPVEVLNKNNYDKITHFVAIWEIDLFKIKVYTDSNLSDYKTVEVDIRNEKKFEVEPDERYIYKLNNWRTQDGGKITFIDEGNFEDIEYLYGDWTKLNTVIKYRRSISLSVLITIDLEDVFKKGEAHKFSVETDLIDVHWTTTHWTREGRKDKIDSISIDQIQDGKNTFIRHYGSINVDRDIKFDYAGQSSAGNQTEKFKMLTLKAGGELIVPKFNPSNGMIRILGWRYKGKLFKPGDKIVNRDILESKPVFTLEYSY